MSQSQEQPQQQPPKIGIKYIKIMINNRGGRLPTPFYPSSSSSFSIYSISFSFSSCFPSLLRKYPNFQSKHGPRSNIYPKTKFEFCPCRNILYNYYMKMTFNIQLNYRVSSGLSGGGEITFHVSFMPLRILIK